MALVGRRFLTQILAQGGLQLPNGAAGRLPVSDAAGNLTLADPSLAAGGVPSCCAYQSAATSATTGTTVVVPLNTERWDLDSIHDTVTNNSRMTCKTPGLYRVTGNAEWSSNTAGFRQIYLRLNGATILAAVVDVPGTAGASQQVVTCELQMAVGDYVELIASQNSGSTLTITGNAQYSQQVTMTYIGGNSTNLGGVPAARAYVASGSQSVASGGGTAIINLPSEEFDTDNMHDPSVNNSRLTIKTPGIYQVDAWAQWNVTTGGFTEIRLMKNGVANSIGGSSLNGQYTQVSDKILLNAGDYLEVQLQNGTGGALSAATCVLTAVWQTRNANQSLIPQRVTSLPGSPYDGQEIYYVADATNGVIWHLRYNAGSASAYKWEYLGGPPLWSEVTTAGTTTSITYAALGSAGPSVTLPLAGDYDVEIGADFAWSSGAAGQLFMSYDIGATGAVDADAAQHGDNANTLVFQILMRRTRRKTGMVAATALTSKYKVNSATVTGNFSNRFMIATPVRVG